jgi:hypothetical protein
MRADHGLIVVAMSLFAVGCVSKDATDPRGNTPSLSGHLRAGVPTFTPTDTSTSTYTSTATGTVTKTVTLTQTTTGTATSTNTASATLTLTATSTATATQTGTGTQTITQTTTTSGTQTASVPGTYGQVYTFTGTITATGTAIAYYTSWPHSQGNTATTTSMSYSNGTGITTVTRTVTSTSNRTETKTATATISGTGTRTGVTTVTVTATVTSSLTNAGVGTRTISETGTGSGTASQTWTATWTTQITQTGTSTVTSTASGTRTLTNTVTLTNTSTLTQTQTQTVTGTTSSTGTATSTATDTGTATVTVTLTGTGTGTSVDGGVADGCLSHWRDKPCGQWCLGQTQSDLAVCYAYLDCYLANKCGPGDPCTTNPDGVCGVNVVRPAAGTAPKTVADQVYQCLGCSGTPPAGVRLAVSSELGCGSGSTGADGQRTFDPPVLLKLPRKIPVTRGSAGNGTATLTVTRSGDCGAGCDFTCSYKGGAAVSHPVSLLDRLAGAYYGFVSCSNGMVPHQVAYVRGLSLHVESGDCQSGPMTAVYDGYFGQAPTVTPLPPTQVFVNSHGFDPPPSPGDPLSPDGGVIPIPPLLSNPASEFSNVVARSMSGLGAGTATATNTK